MESPHPPQNVQTYWIHVTSMHASTGELPPPRLSPASALDKTPPMADSSTERDMLNDSDGSVAIFSMTMTGTT